MRICQKKKEYLFGKNGTEKMQWLIKIGKLEERFFLLLEVIEKREHEESTQRGYP